MQRVKGPKDSSSGSESKRIDQSRTSTTFGHPVVIGRECSVHAQERGIRIQLCNLVRSVPTIFVRDFDVFHANTDAFDFRNTIAVALTPNDTLTRNSLVELT